MKIITTIIPHLLIESRNKKKKNIVSAVTAGFGGFWGSRRDTVDSLILHGYGALFCTHYLSFPFWFINVPWI